MKLVHGGARGWVPSYAPFLRSRHVPLATAAQFCPGGEWGWAELCTHPGQGDISPGESLLIRDLLYLSRVFLVAARFWGCLNSRPFV